MINKSLALMVGVGLFVGVTLFSIIGWSISMSNSEVTIRSQVIAKSQERDVVFDNTWKIIAQKAQVADKYKDSFKEIYPMLMSERYKQGESQLAKLVVEANPTLDSSVYKDVMNAIEVQRNTFTRTQKELIDINREHGVLLDKFPGTVLFSVLGREKIEIKLVTSDKTEDVIKTGKENDVKVF